MGRVVCIFLLWEYIGVWLFGVRMEVPHPHFRKRDSRE